MAARNYLSYLFNPLELLRTKKVLQVNPTVASPRKEPEEIKIFIHDYDMSHFLVKELHAVSEFF